MLCTKRHRFFSKRNHSDEVFRVEDFIEQLADVMEIFVADLDEDAAAGREQLMAEQESIAQISEVTVQT
jgi:hypothetical protein